MIKSKGNQAFSVPNNDEGKLFMELARKFRAKGTSIRLRGRAKNRREAWQKAGGNVRPHYVPTVVSDWIAVYVTPSRKRRRVGVIGGNLPMRLEQ